MSIDRSAEGLSNFHQGCFRSAAARKLVRNSSLSERLRLSLRGRVHHLCAMADRSKHGFSHRSGCGSFLCLLSHGVARPQEVIRCLRHRNHRLRVYPVLRQITACPPCRRTSRWTHPRLLHHYCTNVRLGSVSHCSTRCSHLLHKYMFRWWSAYCQWSHCWDVQVGQPLGVLCPVRHPVVVAADHSDRSTICT